MVRWNQELKQMENESENRKQGKGKENGSLERESGKGRKSKEGKRDGTRRGS